MRRPAFVVTAWALLFGVNAAPVAASPPLDLPPVSDAQLAAATHPLGAAIAKATHPIQLNSAPLTTDGALIPGQATRLASDVLFDFGSATPRPSGTRAIAALVLPLPKGAKLAITGHTDSIGADAFNLDLSKRRAEAVAKLVGGVRPDLVLTVAGKGEGEPVASNGTAEQDDPEGRAKNRRVELRYTS